jgi:hypothetical protein
MPIRKQSSNLENNQSATGNARPPKAEKLKSITSSLPEPREAENFTNQREQAVEPALPRDGELSQTQEAVETSFIASLEVD